MDKPTITTPDDLRNALDACGAALMGDLVPCSAQALDRRMGKPDAAPCLRRDTSLRKGAVKRKDHHRPLREYDPEKMCEACACYWHVSIAQGLLYGVLRTRNL